MENHHGPTRRDMAVTAAGLFASSAANDAMAQASTNAPLKVGLIGAGWFGKLNLFALMNITRVDVLAICDVDRQMLLEAAQKTMARTDVPLRQTHAPTLYEDYRQMLAAHRFDIVIVGTPDHWHALPAIAAMEAGADVYLEKPIGVDLGETTALLNTARRTGRTVQTGTQRRVSNVHRAAKSQIIDTGLLGTVGLIEAFCYYEQRPANRSPEAAIPAGLNWDFYCGPAPLVPYRADMHPRGWRAYQGFCNGFIGDVGIHMIDLARAWLDLGGPNRIYSHGGVFVDRGNDTQVPDTQVATFEYENLTMTWTNRPWGANQELEPWGVKLHGAGGTLIGYTDSWRWQPKNGEIITQKLIVPIETYPQDRQEPEWLWNGIEMTRQNMADFLAARDEHRLPGADIAQCATSTNMVIMANQSAALHRVLEVDAEAGNIFGDYADYNLAYRAYRAPWRRPTTYETISPA